MENKKIDTLFGLVVIAFLAVTVILIKEFNVQRANDFKEYTAALTNIVRQKNDKIRVLSDQLAIAEKEVGDLRNTLTDTRNSLEALSTKLVQPASVAVPAAAAK